MGNRFTEKDVEKAIEFLNFVATHAEFNKLSVKAVIDFYKLLSWSQAELLPKIKDHVLEIKKFEQIVPEHEAIENSLKVPVLKGKKGTK